MEKILKKIQDTLNKYTNVLAEILNAPVVIIDNKMQIISSSQNNEGHREIDYVAYEYIYNQLLDDNKSKIIREPGKDYICKRCPECFSCDKKLEIYVPVKIENEIVCIINVYCSDDSQKEYLMSNFDNYFALIEQLRDFVSSKIGEVIEIEKNSSKINLLNLIADEIEEAVIILEKNKRIAYANKKARSILNIDEFWNDQVKLDTTGNKLLGEEEYKLTLDNKEYFLVGHINDIQLTEKKYRSIFIFNETRAIKNKISEIVHMDDEIVDDEILGVSDKIMNMKNSISKIAKSTSTVLIIGESGVGKEIIARSIHKASARAKEKFVTVKCGSMPDNILECELFGAVKDSLNGEELKNQIGKFEEAKKGTIFLDEIGDLHLYMQVKLLKAIQDMEITKIGADEPTKIDVRIIAATNKNLETMIAEGTFREDLYYRLSVIPIEVPSLRERVEDIKTITYYFANKYSKLFNKKFIGIDTETWNYMLNYNWPGNIRELQNTVEFMINMIDNTGVIKEDALPKKIIINSKKNCDTVNSDIINLRELEIRAIRNALNTYGDSTKGKKTAAVKLGIGIATLYRKIEQYGLAK